MSRDILLRRPNADTFLSRRSAQLFERALVIELRYRKALLQIAAWVHPLF